MKHLIYFGVLSIITLIYSMHAGSKTAGVVLYIFHFISFILLVVAYIIL